MEIIVVGAQDSPHIPMIRNWAQTVLVAQALPQSTEIGILLADKQKIQELNAEHREKDAPTDVLSFPIFSNMEELSDEAEFAAEGQPLLIGDIALCLDIAFQNAQADGISFEQELRSLVIHGILHLLGFDHEGESEADKSAAKDMKERETSLLALLSEKQ